MPPKRRGGATKAVGASRAKRGKKAVVEDEPEATTSNPIKDAMSKLKTGGGKKKGATADSLCPLSGASVSNNK